MMRFCPALRLAAPALRAAESPSHYRAVLKTGTQDLPIFCGQQDKVELGKVSLMRYPERPDFARAIFEQNDPNSNLSDRKPKRQFRSRENGRLKIIHKTSL
ncbi:MAG: hypothetical protein B7X93_07205 [Hydrogenophilales bacterium 17-61-9]|nr:MAG: hypothetical protein B7X93_07205 [Hydrogenophilales bacterium 17-61-9]